jgi:ribosomal protein S18 acetylase RimI-like enzyme
LQQNVSLLARCVLRRPWLLADLLTRKRITSLVETVKRLALPPKAKPAASTEPKGRKRPFDILAIAVHPRLQGGGIGKALMRRAEEIALQNGFHVMTLMVATDNAPAVGFYESIGWSKAPMNGRWRGNMVRWLDLSP